MPPAWIIAAGVLVVLAAFVIGQRFVVGTSPDSGTVSSGAPFASSGAPSSADIANMSPEEAANRLFDRVMRYSSEGKADSAAIFAPMAIMAYERIGPLDLHARYDIGMIANASGDSVTARAQADTILTAQPTHLLGLLLAARAADMRKEAAAASRFRSRFAAAAPAERGRQLREYADHQRDIDEQLGKSSKTP